MVDSRGRTIKRFGPPDLHLVNGYSYIFEAEREPGPIVVRSRIFVVARNTTRRSYHVRRPLIRLFGARVETIGMER